MNLFLREQSSQSDDRELSLFFKEKVPKNVEEIALIAAQYREARDVNASN